jgi:hypothetical protein
MSGRTAGLLDGRGTAGRLSANCKIAVHIIEIGTNYISSVPPILIGIRMFKRES